MGILFKNNVVCKKGIKSKHLSVKWDIEFNWCKGVLYDQTRENF